jgi:hypothetical protein
MGRYRHKVYEKSTTPRWVAVFGLQWQVIESHRLEPGADLLGAMTTTIERLSIEGWRTEDEPRFGFVFITKERNLPQGSGNGNAGVSPSFREASRARAPDSPAPGECRDSTNSPADGEVRRLLMLTPRDPFDTSPQTFSPFQSVNRRPRMRRS